MSMLKWKKKKKKESRLKNHWFDCDSQSCFIPASCAVWKMPGACYQSRGVELGMLHHPIMSQETATAFHPLTTLPCCSWMAIHLSFHPSIHPSIFDCFIQCRVLHRDCPDFPWSQSAHLAGTTRCFLGQPRVIVPPACLWVQEHLSREASQLVPLNVEQQWNLLK